MPVMIAIPDELVVQVKSAAHAKELDKFVINAARKEVRHIRARQLREEYERTHRHRVPRQVYETTLTQVVAFETKYGLSSEQFLQDFEAAIIDDDPKDWVALYRWGRMTSLLQHM